MTGLPGISEVIMCKDIKDRKLKAFCLWPVIFVIGLHLSACPLDKDCFDPDDPCPNNMLEDEYGCIWDHCGGDEFWGERIPCLDTDPNDTMAYWTLVGDDSRYMAYVEDMTDENGVAGPLWIHDFVNGEQRRITEADSKCIRPRAEGNRIGCLEVGEYIGSAMRAADLLILDVVTGEQWQIPNSERKGIVSYSISGDQVVFVARHQFVCSGIGQAWDQVWIYDLVTREKQMIADSVENESRATNAEIADGVVAYWRWSGLCSDDYWGELRLYDLASGEDRLFKQWTSHLSGDNNRFNDFGFDGAWLAFEVAGGIRAFSVDGIHEIDVAWCKFLCDINLSEGKIAYTQQGADGLDQTQVHVFDLATEVDSQITDVRPYYDGASVHGFLNGRLLWSEVRGLWTLFDDCGNVRVGTSSELLFWKDIEF